MTGKMKMMTTGKMTMSESDVNAYTNFKDLFDMQKSNQINMLKNGMYDQYIDWVTKNERKLPIDHPQLASYHIQQLISEIGEVLDADKRWKNMRNDKYDKDNKLDEIADCFIVLKGTRLSAPSVLKIFYYPLFFWQLCLSYCLWHSLSHHNQNQNTL